MLDKLKSWILPKEIDFFKSLSEQSLHTLHIVEELSTLYSENTDKDSGHILVLITELKKKQSGCLKELYATFITPVDRESLSRAYAQLYWVALSIKHFITEVDAYNINKLTEYNEVFGLLQREMKALAEGYNCLSHKEYNAALKTVNHIIHLDNEFIKHYAQYMAQLFNESEVKHILMHKEILAQLKEISKRIHICGNLIEDMVFKIN